jgi:ABC-2 type transport system permease protein
VGPLVALFLLSWIFQAGVPRDLPVAVVDLDHSSMSRQIARYVDATPIAAVNRNFVSLDEARQAMENGRVDAVLYIPDETEQKILKGQSGNVLLYLNNINVVKGGVLNSGIRKALSTLSTGIKLRTWQQRGMVQEQAMARVMPVQVRSEILFNPYTSYTYYLTAGFMPALLIVFVLLGTIYSLGTELFRGTGPSLMKAGANDIRVVLFGKMFPYTIIYFSLAMVMNIMLFLKMGLPLHGNFHIILLGELLLIIAYQFVGVFLIGLTGNMRLSLSLGAAYSMLGLTFSGLTYPSMGMTGLMQVISLAFPYTHWLKILIGQSLRGEPSANAFMYMLILIFFIILGLLLIPRYRYLLISRASMKKE